MSNSGDDRPWYDQTPGVGNDVPTLGNTPSVPTPPPGPPSPPPPPPPSPSDMPTGVLPPVIVGASTSVGPKVDPSYPTAPGGDRPSRSSENRGLWIGIGVLSVLLVIGLVVGALLLIRSSDSDTTVTAADDTTADSDTVTSTTAASTSSTASTAPTTSVVPGGSAPAPPTKVAPTAPAATAAPAAPIGDVRSLSDGLLCRDLKARGYSYSAAVDYWRVHGQPDRMDADKNGIPCETVYPRSDVTSYWPSTSYQAVPYYGLPSGLLCRDLANRGINVYGALLYYIWEGYPSRMDADGNGIPCETVYYDARQVWLNEF